jgi:hypothetical protein
MHSYLRKRPHSQLAYVGLLIHDLSPAIFSIGCL